MTVRTILITDVVDSTALAERMGESESRRLWAEHDRRARDVLSRLGGLEISRTDGLLLLFEDVAAAACFALEYHNIARELGFLARAGVHVGAIELIQNTASDIALGAKSVEVEGVAKPIAARIMSLARGGQTLLSAAARTALGDRCPEGSRLESHGFYRLKGIETPVEMFELGIPGRAMFAPPADVDKAYRVMFAGDLWRPLQDIVHSLPAERDAFVGRSAELRELAARLDGGARLLTVVGTGGTGKTRLACRYGWTWLGDWPGGVYFCDLSEARSVEGIVFAVSSALGVALGSADPVLQLGHAIAGRGRCLVILDNFEQVVEHVGATLGRWLDRASNAAFLVTSRARLHLGGEVVMPLEPMPLGDEAVELFAVRAQAQRSDFALSPANRDTVREIVRLLDGLPLSIELAASRVTILSLPQLLARLSDRFRLLAGQRGTGRQATLRAAIDWSWTLLVPWEQSALAQCSVFEGGFTLEAAEAVLNLARWPEAPPTFDMVQSLVDKSLLRIWRPVVPSRYVIEEPHFGMYVSIHEYARERLRADEGTAVAADERHGRYFATFGSDAAIDALARHGGVMRRQALAFELDNVVAACRRAIARRDAPTAAATCRAAWAVLELQGPYSTAASLARDALALDRLPAINRHWLLMSRGLALQRTGRIGEARTCYEEALVLAGESGRRDQEALARFNLANLHHESGNVDEALAGYEAALAIHRATADARGELLVLGSLGNLRAMQGRRDEAAELLQGACRLAQAIGERRAEGLALGNLGCLRFDQGKFEEALTYFEDALVIDREIANRRAEGHVLGNLGSLHQNAGRPAAARESYERALAIHREAGNRLHEGYILGTLGALLISEGCIDEARNALRAGEHLLREFGEPYELAATLATRARLESDAGNADAAREAVAEAARIAASLGVGPDSELARTIAAIRAAIA